MDFAYSDRVQELRARLLDFFDRHIHPAEATHDAELAHRIGAERWRPLEQIPFRRNHPNG
jgi:acyl-CoA dehydrogenase